MAIFTVTNGEATDLSVVKVAPILQDCFTLYQFIVTTNQSDSLTITLNGNHYDATYTNGGIVTSFTDTATIVFNTSVSINFLLLNSGVTGVISTATVNITNNTTSSYYENLVQRDDDSADCFDNGGDGRITDVNLVVDDLTFTGINGAFNGVVDLSQYLTISDTFSLQEVTDIGNTTTNFISTESYIIAGGINYTKIGGSTMEFQRGSFGIQLTPNTITKNSAQELQDKSGVIALVEDLDAYLPLTGGTMSGNINMGNQGITNINDIYFSGGSIFFGESKLAVNTLVTNGFGYKIEFSGSSDLLVDSLGLTSAISNTLIDSTGNRSLITLDYLSTYYTPLTLTGVTQLSDLTDVNTSTPTNRNVLVADGTDWESRPLVEADISDLVHGGTPTGLEALDEGNGIGWRLIGKDPADYVNLGFNAVDFSSSAFGTNLYGATGTYSFATGRLNKSSGTLSFTMGQQNEASGSNSFSGGSYNSSENSNTFSFGNEVHALGSMSTAIGKSQTAYSYGEFSIGFYSTAYTASSLNSFVGTDRLFNIGNGLFGSLSNAFTILKNGLTTLPSVTNALIDASGTGKEVATTEWVNAQGFGGGSGDMVLASAQTVTGTKTFSDTAMKLRNVANTFDGYFVNTNTIDRVYTLQDAAGTLAFTDDVITNHTLLSNIGTNTHAQIDTHIADATLHFTEASISITESQVSDLQNYSLVGHSHLATKAQYDASLTDGNFIFVGDAPTAHTHVIADITDFTDNSAAWDLQVTNNSGTNTGDQDLSGYVTLATIQSVTGDKIYSGKSTFNPTSNNKILVGSNDWFSLVNKSGFGSLLWWGNYDGTTSDLFSRNTTRKTIELTQELNSEGIVINTYDNNGEDLIVGTKNQVAVIAENEFTYLGQKISVLPTNKKWVIFGDSFSNSLTGDYPENVITNLGLTGTVTNAVAGDVLASQIVDLDALLLSDANYFDAFDICSLHIGVNDWNADTELGSLTDTSADATFIGQLKDFIEKVLTSNPDIELYIITPTEGNSASIPYKGFNGKNYKVEQLSQAMVKVANQKGIRSIDLNSLSQFNLQTIPTYTSDLLHPSAEGRIVLGSIVSDAFINKTTNGNTSPNDNIYRELGVSQGTNSTATKFTIENTDVSLLSGEDLGSIDFITNDSNSGNGIAGSIRSVLEDGGFWYGLAFNVKASGSEFEAMRIDHNGYVTVKKDSNTARFTIERTGSAASKFNTSVSQDVIFNYLTGTGGYKWQIESAEKMNLSEAGDLTVNQYVIGNGFKITGLDDTYLSLAGGGSKLVSDFALQTDLSGYLLNTTDTFTGKLDIDGSIEIILDGSGNATIDFGTGSGMVYNSGVTTFDSDLNADSFIIGGATADEILLGTGATTSLAAINNDIADKQDKPSTQSAVTAIDMSKTAGNQVNMAAANGTATYTVTGSVVGGNATVLYDSTGDSAFPTVTGATPKAGSTFEAAVEYHMHLTDYGATRGIEYYFVRLDALSGGGGTVEHSSHKVLRWELQNGVWTSESDFYWNEADTAVGSGATAPTWNNDNQGLLTLEEGDKITRIMMTTSFNNNEVDDLQIYIAGLGSANGITDADFDAASYVEEVILAKTAVTIATLASDTRGWKQDINYTLLKDRIIAVAMRSDSTLTSNRIVRVSMTIFYEKA